MAKRTNSNRKVATNRASPQSMLMATQRSNGHKPEKANAYFYGNMGDSIERRYSGLDGAPFSGFGGVTWDRA
jgi:hypothetical protein